MEKTGNYIRFDWAMKHMLRDKANFGILEGLISVLLKDNITVLDIIENDSNCKSINFNGVDINAKNSADQCLIIRLYYIRELYYLYRIIGKTCDLINEHINIGEKYDHVKKVYSISILYWNYGDGEDYVYRGDNILRLRGINKGDELRGNVKGNDVIMPHIPKEVFPEYYLIRVNAFTKAPENHLDEWMEYLKTGIVKDSTSAPGLQQVKEKLRLWSMNPEERRSYDEHMDNIMVQNDVLDTARDEGRAEGLAEGRAEGIEMVALNMLKLGVADNIISSSTGLSLEYLARLKGDTML